MVKNSWEQWQKDWLPCEKCPIGSLSYKHVLGTGSRTAKVLLIGEGPGRSEDTIGLPFIGKAGRLLDKMLAEAGMARTEIFITNLVACRPCDKRTGPNRPPTTDEVLNCRPRLVQLFDLLKPRGVVLIGRPAQFHGQVMLRQNNWKGKVLYMTHPAAFLRQGGPKAPGYGKAVADLKAFWEGV